MIPRLFDLLALLGVLLLTAGVWWIYPPAALIALGAKLLIFSLWGASKWQQGASAKRSSRRRRGSTSTDS